MYRLLCGGHLYRLLCGVLFHRLRYGGHLYILRRVKNFLPASALKTLYFSLSHCHLIYAAEIWGCASKNLLTPIFLKQKQAIRNLSNKKYNAHTEPLFKQNKILPFFDLLEFMKIKFMHSFYFKNLPSSLSNMWTLNRTRNQVQELPALRNEDDFYIPFARTDQTSDSSPKHLSRSFGTSSPRKSDPSRTSFPSATS